MMKKKFVLFISLVFANSAFSQKATSVAAPNIIYLEAAGNGGYGSGNYERAILARNNLMFAARLGLGTYRLQDYENKFNPDILIPIAINGMYGKNHKIELGAGQTFANIVKAKLPGPKPARKSNFHSNFNLGYRYQKGTRGIVFRCAYTPLFEFNRYFRHWAGISLGYAF